MKMILLAAGFGTRLRPLTDTIPKCLVEISGKPLLQYWLEEVDRTPVISRLLINTHYLPERVTDFVSHYPGGEKIEMFYEAALLGTAGTVRANQTWINGEAFILAHADNFSSLEIDRAIAAHRKRPANCSMTMVSFRTSTPETCGILKLDAQGRVVEFYEKSPENHGNLANGAFYICEPEVMDYITSQQKEGLCFSNDIIPAFKGRIFCYELGGHHIDIGTPETYAQAQTIKLHNDDC